MMPLIICVVLAFVFIDLIPAIRTREYAYSFVYVASLLTVLVLWFLIYKGITLTGPNALIKTLIVALGGPSE